MMDDSLLLYKILKNRTGAEISASGNPAIMSDTLKNNPMNEMKVFGWSKQETYHRSAVIPNHNSKYRREKRYNCRIHGAWKNTHQRDSGKDGGFYSTDI